MDDYDLDISNYDLADILNLFKCDYNFDEEGFLQDYSEVLNEYCALLEQKHMF